MNPLYTSFRFLWKNRFFSLINLIGLTIGFTSVVIITAWINKELSFDKFLDNYKNIYRLTIEVNNPNGYHTHFARCWQPWAKQLPDHFSEIEKMALFSPLRKTAIKMDDIKFNSEQVYQCNAEALEIFDIKILSGNAEVALRQPDMVLISESLYNNYFKNLPLMDTIIELSGAFATEFSDFKIAGVYRDFPLNAHFHPEILVSFDDLDKFEGWAYIYFQLVNGNDPKQILNKFDEFSNTHLSEEARNTTTVHFQPISDIHLHSTKDREIEKNGDIKVIWLFSGIGIVILLITLINFINLNMALNLRRRHNFILKKILGSSYWDIASPIFYETLFLIMLSSLMSYVIIFLIEPIIGSLLPTGLVVGSSIYILKIYFVYILIFTVFSFIPQFFLILKTWMNNVIFSGFGPDHSTILKNKKLGYRKILVIFQFIAFIILISGAYYIDLQKKYLWDNRMGFEGESVVVLKDLNWKLREKYPELKERLIDYHSIKEITASMEPPSGYVMDAMGVEMEGLSEDEDISVYVFPVEDNYIDFYDIPIIAGERFVSFSKDSQKEEYILNESALQHLGFETPEEAIGRQFKLNFFIDSLFNGGTIKGVIRDFNLSPLFEPVKPLVLFQKPIWYSTILIKIDTSRTYETLQLIRETWEDLYPDYVFDYSFDDDLYQNAYHNEIIQSKLSKTLTFLAIVIACLGLFGISTIIIQLKTKEISIRKVNGASSGDILFMLSKEFILWIIIALIIATPVNWYILNRWGENYPYKVDLPWWIFPLSGLLALLFAWISISYYSIKASRQNPVEALRYE